MNTRFLYLILVLLPSSFCLAQTQEPKQLGDEEINVVKAYKPVLSEATRIGSSPDGDTSHEAIAAQTYNIAANKISTNIEVTPIKALKVKDETVPRLRNSFVKLGYGNYNTPYAELFVNSLRSKEFQAGVRLKHLSGNGKISSDYSNSQYSDNEIEAYGKRFYDKEILATTISYARHGYHFYGYNTDVYQQAAVPDMKQAFNDFSIHATLDDNTQGKKQLNHSVTLHYNYYSDNYSAQENSVLLHFNVNKKLDIANFGINGGVDYTNDRQPNANLVDRAVIRLNPYATKQINNYTLAAGLNANIEAGGVSGFHLYPQLEATANVIDNVMVAYAVLDGHIEKNTLRELSIHNPFINTQLDMQNTRTFEIKGGLRGNFSHTTTYNAGIAWQSLSNMALYVADTAFKAPTRFKVIYDNASVVTLHAELGHRLNDKWLLTTRAQYSNYSMASELKAWYIPAFVYTLSTVYSMSDKILLRADVFAHSTRYYKVFAPAVESQPLPGVVDANLGFEYRYSKVFSLFLNFNNIGAVNYYKWENYPAQRFQALGGLTFSF